MAADITQLIPSLQRELNPPGTTIYTNATTGEYLGFLQDAFWEIRLKGLLSGYTLDETDDTLIVPQSGTTDLPRELQQLLVIFAGYRVTLTQFQNLNSGFRAKAGPVEFEQQKSAQTLRGILDALRDRIKEIVDALPSELSAQFSMYAFEGYMERSYQIATGDQWFVL